MPAQNSSAQIPVPSNGPSRRIDWRGLAAGAVLAAAAMAAYSRTFAVPLLFDDVGSIANNPSIRHWGTAFWAPIDTTAGGRPVLNLSLAVNYAVGGTAVWGYHAVNLAIHVLAGLTLFGILRRLFASLPGAPADSAAFCAALLWMLHPLQTESVTYIVQRAESLMGLFYLLTLYCFVRGAEEGPVFAGASAGGKAAGHSTSIWFGLSWLACLLGMATKEVMVSAPLIVLLYDRTFLAGSFREAWRRRRGIHAGLAATWIALAFLVFSAHGRGGTSGFGSGVSWWRYAPTQFPAVVRYLKLSVWPHPLVFDYGTQWVTDFRAVAPSAVVLAGLIAATAWALGRRGAGARSLGLAGAWFLAILAPTSLVPGNRQTAAEHRMYLALIPMVVLAVFAIHRRLGRAALPLCLAAAAGLFTITYERNEDYRSALSLWSATAADCPENPFVYNNLGTALEAMPGRLDDAIAQYEKALRLEPGLAEARNNLGYALTAAGRVPEAISELEAAVRILPRYAEAHNNLGNALCKAPGRLDEAIAHYEEALRLKPDYAEAHNNLGNALVKLPGRSVDAIAHYREALRLKPDFAEAHNDLGYALGRTPGRLDEAIAELGEAIRLKPGFAEAHGNLGNVLAAAGRTADAIAHYEVVVRLRPDSAEARNNLGNTLQRMPGRLDEAIAQFGEAIRLRPDYVEAHYNLGNALNAAGRAAEAVAQYEEAIRLKPDFAAAHNNLGNTLNAGGRIPEAIAQYEEALRLGPDQAAVHFNLAVALLKTPGRTREAAAHLEATLRLQPGNDLARQILSGIQAPPP